VENTEQGQTSWYAVISGRRTANSERYDQNRLTAPTNPYLFGTWLGAAKVNVKRWMCINDAAHSSLAVSSTGQAAAKLRLQPWASKTLLL
jgi:hypothetical protein